MTDLPLVNPSVSLDDSLTCVGGVVLPSGVAFSVYGTRELPLYHPHFLRHLYDNIDKIEVGKAYTYPLRFFVVQSAPHLSLSMKDVGDEDWVEEFCVHYRLTGGETGKPYACNDTELKIIPVDEFLANKRKGLTVGARVCRDKEEVARVTDAATY